MEKMTITEALAEVKLIGKKVEKKRETVLTNLTRVKIVPDPFKDEEGGANGALTREIQSVESHLARLCRIRGAIAKANLNTQLTLNESQKSVSEWLAWKREVAEGQLKFLADIPNKTKAALDSFTKNPSVYKDPEGKVALHEIVTNLDYPLYLKKYEQQQDLFEQLDGKLSLLNATTVVEF
jgi:hypothetical protein